MVIHHRLQQQQQQYQDYANIQIRVQPTSPISTCSNSPITNCTNIKCNNNNKCSPVTSSNGGTCGHHSPLSPMSPSLLRDVPVRLNVSGQLFMCSMQTLTSEEGSYFSCLVNFHHHQQQQQHHQQHTQQFLSVPPQQHTHQQHTHSPPVQEFFIDRDATHFQLILNHLRGYDVASAVEQLRGSERELLAQDVRFYNIQSMFRYFPLMACSGGHSSDKFVIAVSGNGRGNSLSNQVKLFDARTGRGLHSIMASHETGAQTSHVIASCCSLNNNNSYSGNKATSSSSPSSSLFSPTGGISTTTTPTTMNTTTSCLIHLSDHHFVTSYKNEMKLWDGFTGSCQSVWCDQSDDITALFALNSQQFASLSRNHELKVYDINSKRCLYTLNHIVQVIVLNSDTFLCQRLNGSVDVRQKKCGTTTVRDNSHHNNKDQRPLHELIRTITDPLLKGACIISLQEPNNNSCGGGDGEDKSEDVRFVFGNGHCAKVWNAMSGNLEGVIYDPLSRFDQMVLVKPKVRLIATMYNQSVHLWNMTTMQREYTNRSYSCPGLSKVLPLTDNSFVSIGCSATNALTSLYIWDIAHGKCFLPHFNKNGYVFKGVARLRNGANQADGGFVIVCCREEEENNVARIGVWNPRSEVMYIQEVPFECFDQIAPCQLSVVSL